MKQKTFIFEGGKFVLSQINPGEADREKGVWAKLEPFVDEYFFPEEDWGDCGEEGSSAEIDANREFFSRREAKEAGVEELLDDIALEEANSNLSEALSKAEKIYFPDSADEKICIFPWKGQIFFSFHHQGVKINLEVEAGAFPDDEKIIKEVEVVQGDCEEVYFHLLKETGETLMSTRIARELIEF